MVVVDGVQPGEKHFHRNVSASLVECREILSSALIARDECPQPTAHQRHRTGGHNNKMALFSSLVLTVNETVESALQEGKRRYSSQGAHKEEGIDVMSLCKGNLDRELIPASARVSVSPPFFQPFPYLRERRSCVEISSTR